VTVIRVEGQVYRFLTALPTASDASVGQIAAGVAGSFRLLTEAEKTQLKPLRIRIVTARPGDTVDSLSRRMDGIDRKPEMFRLLNDFATDDAVKAGTKYKIIAE